MHLPLKALAFDLGDTLVEYEGVPLNWEALYPEALRELAAHLRAAPTPDQLAAAGAVLRQYNTRRHPRTAEVSFAVIAAGIAPALGCSDPLALDEHACATPFFRVFRHRLRRFPDTAPALAVLRARGLKLGAFTDVPYGMPRALVLEDLQTAGLADAFDAWLTSRDVGARKPDPAPLRRLASALVCPPNQMAYVGNERKDVDSALACGCTGILLDRAGRRPAWGQHRTISSLAEL